MYRIHFNANGALGTERAVLEIGPAGFRWRFDPQGNPTGVATSACTLADQGPPIAMRHLKSRRFVMRDYASRWPAYERQRRMRRWKAELADDIALVVNDLRDRFDALKQSLFPAPALLLRPEQEGANDGFANSSSNATPIQALDVA